MKLVFALFVLLVAVPVTAADQWFKDWVSGPAKDGTYFAGTFNESGSMLVQYCSPDTQNCVWILTMKTRCETGDKYPVLANSDAGSFQLMIYCDGLHASGKYYRYGFTQFDEIDSVVRRGKNVGFAVALDDGYFQVTRFSLNGATAALVAMHETAQQAHTKGPRDYRM